MVHLDENGKFWIGSGSGKQAPKAGPASAPKPGWWLQEAPSSCRFP